MCGGPRSILIGTVVVDAVLPALSIAVPEIDWAPSDESTWSGGQVATPDPEALHVKCTVTGAVYQPLAFGDEPKLEVMVGGVRSMLMPAGVAVPTLPARSAACPDTERLVPSDESVIGDVNVPGATPDNASLAAN